MGTETDDLGFAELNDRTLVVAEFQEHLSRMFAEPLIGFSRLAWRFGEFHDGERAANTGRRVQTPRRRCSVLGS